MCGIAGVLQWSGAEIDPGVLSAMTAALGHRGPDGQGMHRLHAGGVAVGLGHTRLKVVDTSDAANQPMSNEDGSCWIVFNGEIYNFQELRADLQRRGMRFRTSSDTEVLLRLYEADGEACLPKLEGMFAFAVWDGRRRQLLLARDRAGKKPLFYADTPALVAFGSEIKALLRHPALRPQVNTSALPAFFLYGNVPGPATLYEGIRAVPPGCAIRINEHGIGDPEPYWRLPEPSGRHGRPGLSVGRAGEREAAGRVRELLTAAVRRRLIADVPLGAFLSGGLDSTVVVGLMSRLMPERVRTFSIGFPQQTGFNELPYARLAARRFRTAHTEFIVQPSAVELVERLVWHHDGPFGDSSAIPTYLLAECTRRHVTVALTGDGGDELFAGYLRFAAAVQSERVPLALRRAARGLAGLPPWGGPRSLWRRLQKFAGSAAQPVHERFRRWSAVFSDDVDRLCPWAGAPGGVSSLLGAAEAAAWPRGEASALSRLLRLNFTTYLPDDLLVKMDRCAMAHGLETRSPFLDRELVEYAFALPDAMKLRGWQTKVILRRAVADLVPSEILRRPKMGFGVPLQQWFRRDLREFLHDALETPQARLKAYVDQAYVRRLLADHARGRADHSARLWLLLTLEVWLRNLSLAEPASLHGTVEARA